MKKIVLLLSTVALAFTMNAQTQISAHLGGALALGGFEDIDNSVAVNLGAKATFGIANVENVGIIGTLDLFFNSTNGGINVESYPKVINIPLMVGVNYLYPVGGVSLFGELALGPNFRKVSEFKSGMSDGGYLKFNYSPNLTFAWQIGAGLIFAERFSVGLHYYMLGNGKAKGDYESLTKTIAGDLVSSGNIEDLGTEKFGFGMLAVRFGYRF